MVVTLGRHQHVGPGHQRAHLGVGQGPRQGHVFGHALFADGGLQLRAQLAVPHQHQAPASARPPHLRKGAHAVDQALLGHEAAHHDHQRLAVVTARSRHEAAHVDADVMQAQAFLRHAQLAQQLQQLDRGAQAQGQLAQHRRPQQRVRPVLGVKPLATAQQGHVETVKGHHQRQAVAPHERQGVDRAGAEVRVHQGVAGRLELLIEARGAARDGVKAPALEHVRVGKAIVVQAPRAEHVGLVALVGQQLVVNEGLGVRQKARGEDRDPRLQ
jgi:hypothetical protein